MPQKKRHVVPRDEDQDGDNEQHSDGDSEPFNYGEDSSSEADLEGGDAGGAECSYRSKRRCFPHAVLAEIQESMGCTAVSKDTVCVFCFQPIRAGDRVVIDHICPTKWGGPTHSSNAAVLHEYCNTMKGTGSMLQGPGVRALTTLLTDRSPDKVVADFIALLANEVLKEQATLKRPTPKRLHGESEGSESGAGANAGAEARAGEEAANVDATAAVLAEHAAATAAAAPDGVNATTDAESAHVCSADVRRGR